MAAWLIVVSVLVSLQNPFDRNRRALGTALVTRHDLHTRFASKLGNWTTEGEPGLLQTGLRCHQRKTKHCSCAKMDPDWYYYGLPHGFECPAEVGRTSSGPSTKSGTVSNTYGGNGQNAGATLHYD
ncbi:hypothetical protein BCR37DRAFT_382845 [Protomyces lactucae-debilis]|uniref:Uncharacterized protein n=1 Tax=Protomyces lactucae-debilis TaxID=2754530 RepID=A0A1Y2F0C3_PROLT|nr:uncharacterized protein BCR37DRAFT_382845 [Protomyces lactucae-debilis]ORY77332.1 hypothetical protein BCR37DRAFT_382845 [Protomyces lactucae-debilis]